MPDLHIIKLRKPVGEVTEIRLREPRAGEVLRASLETGRGLALSLLAQVTGHDVKIIQALPGRVTDRALAYLMTFVEPILADPAEGESEQAEIPDEMTIDLADTVQIGTTWVNRLDLHEPTLGELIKVEKYDGMQRVFNLVALASGQSRHVIEMVPVSEYARAAAFVIPFMHGVPESGAESSDT